MKLKMEKWKNYNYDIDYKIGDIVSSYNDDRDIGVCTGFTHDNTCIVINFKVFGGKYYFKRSSNYL